MARYRIVLTDHSFRDVAYEQVEAAKIDAEFVDGKCQTKEDIIRAVPGAHAITHFFMEIDADVMDAAGPQLRVISRYGTGIDSVDVAAATARNLPVINVVDYCHEDVADHALALLFCLVRKLMRLAPGISAGTWTSKGGGANFIEGEAVLDRVGTMGRITGKTLGIVGLGTIGRTLARKAKGLGLPVIAHSPSVPDAVFAQEGVECVDFSGLLARSDYISIHTPLNDRTQHLFNADAFSAMKPTAFLICASRGGVVDWAACAEALERGEIAGAGTDVFEPEPIPPDHPILGSPNFVATPHLAWVSKEAVEELRRKAIEGIIAVLEGRMPESVINREVAERIGLRS
jgi:D-3-phosphoglycerate dehydrogenase